MRIDNTGGLPSARGNQIMSKVQNKEEVIRKRKLIAAKLLKKVLNSKLRGHMESVRVNSIAYMMHRQ
jgi:hypothetical protein